MRPRLFSGDTELNEFRRLLDFTTFGRPDPYFHKLEVDTTSVSVIWILLPKVRKQERWQPYAVAVTGPSEVGVLLTAPDVTEDSEDVMAVLEIAAEMGDEAAFVRAAERIDWSQRPAVDFVRTVRLALAAGAHLVARNLATQGARLHPDHPELHKMAHILAPPRIVNADIPPTPSVRADQAWLRDHADEYKGQWVALREGTLLAVGAAAREVWGHLESTDDVMLTKVL